MDNRQCVTLRDTYGTDLCLSNVTTDGGSLGGLASTLTYPSLDFAEHAFNLMLYQVGAPSHPGS